MKLNETGNFTGKISSIKLLKGMRFKRESVWFELTVVTESGDWATIELDLTQEYIPRSNPPVTRQQATLQQLENLGWRGNGEFAKLEEDLLDKEVSFYGKASVDEKYVNFYLSGRPVEEVNLNDSKYIISLLSGEEDEEDIF